jgi:plasmid stabilization system protein ParE
MAKITRTAEAEGWLEDIFEYLAACDPDAAARTVAQALGSDLDITVAMEYRMSRSDPFRPDPFTRRLWGQILISRCYGVPNVKI